MNRIQSPAHYRIPNESGYFPAAGLDKFDTLAKIDNVALYQIHPPCYGDKLDGEAVLASGTLTLHDPAAGTADDVALVGQCGDALFYIMVDDATSKTSDSKFMFSLPKDCIVMDLTGCSQISVLQVEGLLAARTKYHDESNKEESGRTSTYPDNLPNDKCSQAIFRASIKVSKLTVRAGEMGASKIDAFGEKKKEQVTQGKDVKVGKASIMIAKGTRTASEKAYKLTEKASDKISDVLGGKVGRAAAIKEGDSATKRKARSLLLVSTISYAEIGSGASEGYELMVKSAQSQATSFFAKKYGKEAAELVRHTAGAAANFGRAALTVKRIVNVKKVVKSAGKQMVKDVQDVQPDKECLFPPSFTPKTNFGRFIRKSIRNGRLSEI